MRDPKTEAYLDRGQFKWKYVEHVPFTDIDLKASSENPARLIQRRDDDRVISYAELMQDGVKFPAIVLLNHDGAQKWIIATGVHRQGAAELVKGVTGIDGYCVTEPDAYRRDVLFRQLNTLEGAGVPIREQIMQVLELHDKYKTPLEQLAQEWHLKVEKLRVELYDKKARSRGLRLGSWDFLRMKPEVPKKSYHALNKIQSDVTYKEATEVYLNHRTTINPAEVEEMVAEVRKTKSEADASVIIARYREAAVKREEGQKKSHARISPAPANKMLSDGKRFVRHRELGLDLLYLSAVDDPEQALVILQAVIDSAREYKIEIERIKSINRPMDSDKVVPLRG